MLTGGYPRVFHDQNENVLFKYDQNEHTGGAGRVYPWHTNIIYSTLYIKYISVRTEQ